MAKDYRLLISRLRPTSAYHWTGADGYAGIGEWRDPNTTKPTQAQLDAEDVIYQAELAQAAAQAATVASTQAVAVTNYAALPNWARTLSADEAAAYINGQIWNGSTAAQVNAYIDAQLVNITTANVAQINAQLANIRALLKLVAGAVLAMRDLFVLTAKLLIYIRDLVIRFRQ